MHIYHEKYPPRRVHFRRGSRDHVIIKDGRLIDLRESLRKSVKKIYKCGTRPF